MPDSEWAGGAAASAQTWPVSTPQMNSIWRPQNTAPFGRPVVPEVKTIATGRSGSSASGGGVPSTRIPRSAPSAPVSAPLGVIVSTSGAAGASGSVATTSDGSARSTTAPRSSGVSRWLTPAVTAPSLAAAA